MTKILVNSQGKALLTGNGKPLTKVSGGGGHTGTVDTVGLTALGWDSYDIQWLQDHVWWDAEDDAEWAVTEANKAFGPNGATPITWSNKSTYFAHPDLRYFPKVSLPANLTNFSRAFAGWPNIIAIPTHGWDLSSVIYFNDAFSQAYLLRSVGDTKGWVTSSATTLSSFFSNCWCINNINTQDWDTRNVTSMAYMCNACFALQSIDISGFSFAKVTTMEAMFSNTYHLSLLKLPATITAPMLTTIANFANYSNLGDISISFAAPTLQKAQNAFGRGLCIRSLTLSISSTVLDTIASLLDSCATLMELDLTGIDTTSCAQSGLGANNNASPVGTIRGASVIKLGANFFKGTFDTLYAVTAQSWSRDSIYESLYTNQTTRNSNSNAVTVKLATQAYDRLSAQDISDIATKNITLTRG